MPSELSEARARLEADRPDLALPLFAQAARKDPASAAALRGLAKSLLEAGAWSRVPRAVDAAVSLEPGSADARLWAADLLEQIEEYGEARRHLREGARANPDAPELKRRRALLELWFGAAREALRSPEPALLGPALVLSKRYAEGAEALSGAGDGEALLWRAEALRKLKRLGDCEKALQQAERRLGRTVGVVVNRALLRLAEGRPADAADVAEMSCRVPRPLWGEPRSADFRVDEKSLEGVLRAMRGNRSGRATYFSEGRLQGHVHFFPRDFLLALQSKIRFGDGDRVLAEFDRLIEERPGEIYLHAARAEVCLWLGREDEAGLHLARARKLGPKRPWPPLGQCALAVLRGDARAARKHWEQAEANHAPPRGLAMWLGEIRLLEGRPKEALEPLSRAAESFPFRPSAWLGLALAKLRAGDQSGARRLFAELKKALLDFLGDRGVESSLVEARRLMRGNRSSWMYTWVGDDGVLHHLKLRLPPGTPVPSEFQHNPWMFVR